MVVPLSANAAFLHTAVFNKMATTEAARKYFPVLRQWAIQGKALKGRIFSEEEVEEAICEVERSAAASSAGASTAPTCGAAAAAAAAAAAVADSTSAPTQLAGKAEKTKSGSGDDRPEGDHKRSKTMGNFWPRWVLDTSCGVEVLAPVGANQSTAWTHATSVGIGHQGQKKRFLSVRAAGFEMDARSSEVRAPGSNGPTVQELQEALVRDGGDPCTNPEWTDCSDGGQSPGKAMPSKNPSKPVHSTSGQQKSIGGDPTAPRGAKVKASNASTSKATPPSRPRPPATPASAVDATPRPQASAPPHEQLREAIDVLLERIDLSSTTLGQVRALMEEHLELEPGTLDQHRDVCGDLLTEKVTEMQYVEEMQTEDDEGFTSWPLEKLQHTLDDFDLKSDGDCATLIERLGPMMQVAAPVKQSTVEYFEVVYGKVAVRAAKDPKSDSIGSKRRGAIVRVNQEDNWVALKDEPGFMLTAVGETVLLEKKTEAALNIEYWEVAYKKVGVRAAKDGASAILGFKNKSTIIRARREDDWLALTDEPGFMLVEVGSQALLEKRSQESRPGQSWTYKFTGMKLAIREGPSIESKAQGDHIENGAVLEVIERVQGTGDTRLYLRLADGRGWAYDKSVKDESKTIVEEVNAKA